MTLHEWNTFHLHARILSFNTKSKAIARRRVKWKVGIGLKCVSFANNMSAKYPTQHFLDPGIFLVSVTSTPLKLLPP